MFTATGLNVPSRTYNLFVYTVNDTANEGASTITVGTTSGPSTHYNVDQTGGGWNSNPVYVNGGSTTNSTSLTPGNYIEFKGVSPDATGTIKFTHIFAGAVGSDTVSYNGLQLVSVPEPASFAVLAIGGLSLLARRRRV